MMDNTNNDMMPKGATEVKRIGFSEKVLGTDCMYDKNMTDGDE